MIYDISFLWIWLLLALILGAAIGWRSEASEPQGPWFHGWFQIALIVLIVAVIAAILHILPGRVGFWVETAVLFFVAYVLGCLFGGAVKRLRATV